MTRLLDRRPSISFTGSKKKKKKANKQKKASPKETKSFRVEADLQHHQANNDVEKTPSPQLSSSSSKGTSSSTDGSTGRVVPSNNNNNNNNNTKYLRGGGYCSHSRRRRYDERWDEAHVAMVIESWKMTPSQRDKLMILKDRVRDVDHYMNCPHQLVYFLKDELGNIDQAEKYFRLHIQRRLSSELYQMDSILTDYELPDDYDYFPMAVLQGTDQEGSPIHVTRTGAADCWGLYKRHGREAMIRHAIFNQELDARGAWIDDYETSHGRKATQFTVIFDLQGLNSSHMRPGLLPVCGTIARVLQDNYPEMVKRVLIIRSPYLFKTIWGLVKHFFDPELRDLMIFGTDDANSQAVMEKYIDPDVLPHCIHPGGKDGPVARGYEHVKMEGGSIPPEGEYKTPNYNNSRQARDDVDSNNPSEMCSDLSDTMVTSNVRTLRDTDHDRGVRARRRQRDSSVKVKCTKIVSGSFNFVPMVENESSIISSEEGFKALIKIA